MKDTNKIITYLINGILLIMTVIICSSLNSLYLAGTLPQFFMDIKLPMYLLVSTEVIYYLLMIYFFSGRSFYLRSWIIGIMFMISSRIIISSLVGITLWLLWSRGGQVVSYVDAFQDAFYGFTLTYFVQFLIAPWIIYPFLVGMTSNFLKSNVDKNKVEPVEYKAPSRIPEENIVSPKELREMMQNESALYEKVTNHRSNKSSLGDSQKKN